MVDSEEKTELIDLRLPRHLVDKLCTGTLLQALQGVWLEAFAKGAEFGMTLVRRVEESKKAAPKKRRKKRV